jgi:hypothetical protein
MANENPFLLDLFRQHGIEGAADDHWITFSSSDCKANAEIVREMDKPGSVSVQLDVRFVASPGRTIIESFVGLGETREQAVDNARQNFLANTFHVLLAAFFQPKDSQVNREEWIIGGQKKRVTLGNVGIRGQVPGDGQEAMRWFQAFQEKIQQRKLSEGINWIRLFFAQMEGKTISCEVLLNNEAWPEVQAEMAAFPWPLGQEFYSVRVFMIVEGGVDLSQAISLMSRQSDDEVLEKLLAQGMPRPQAEKMIALIPLAFGRLLLQSMKVGLANTAILQNPATGKSREIRLDQDPTFIEASRIALEAQIHGHLSQEQSRNLMLRGAEVDAVNQAMDAGSKPEDLDLSPPIIFSSDESFEPSSLPDAARGKPWWKFW